MSRLLPAPSRDEFEPDEHEPYDRVVSRYGSAGAVGYFGALLHSPPICDAVNAGSLAFRAAEQRGTLATELREWIDVVVGHELGSPWLVHAHLPAAVGAGIRPAAIAAICAGRDAELEPDELELTEFIRRAVHGRMTDEAFAGLVERFGKRRAVEFTAFTCWVSMNTRLAQALGQPEVAVEELLAAIDGYLDRRS